MQVAQVSNQNLSKLNEKTILSDFMRGSKKKVLVHTNDLKLLDKPKSNPDIAPPQSQKYLDVLTVEAEPDAPVTSKRVKPQRKPITGPVIDILSDDEIKTVPSKPNNEQATATTQDKVKKNETNKAPLTLLQAQKETVGPSKNGFNFGASYDAKDSNVLSTFLSSIKNKATKGKGKKSNKSTKKDKDKDDAASSGNKNTSRSKGKVS